MGAELGSYPEGSIVGLISLLHYQSLSQENYNFFAHFYWVSVMATDFQIMIKQWKGGVGCIAITKLSLTHWLFQ